MSNPSNRASMRGQLTLRGVVIGVLGCVIITASSAYTALKMGALPWPIVFAAVISLFFLKLMGNASLNEANVDVYKRQGVPRLQSACESRDRARVPREC